MAASVLVLAANAHAAPVPVESMAAGDAVPWRRDAVLALAEKVGDWQLAHLGDVPKTQWGSESITPTAWEQGALFIGLAALADRSQKPEFAQAVLARGQLTKWQPGPRPYHADDYSIAASYLWDSRHGAGDAAIAPTRARLDAILAAPPTADLSFDHPDDCQTRWCWCDALFMAPPVWFEMSKITGDPKYAAFAKQEFRATAGYLYDEDSHLFFRDSRFFDRRDINGNKLFWSRGNGWVFAGLARIIPLLDDSDPDRSRFVTLFQDMAAELKTIQKPDGFWAPSLLGDPDTALPEESGTGFYTFGMAWGIKAGLLDRTQYEPVVRKGWAALTRTVHGDGTVGYVQPVSDRPDNVGYNDTQFYGTGAFLLAATAVADLDLPPIGPLKTVVVENPSDHDQAAAPILIPGIDGDSRAGGWSVEMDGRVYAAEAAPGGNIMTVLPLKAHARMSVRVMPQPAPLPQRVLATLNVQDGGLRAGDTVVGGEYHLHKDFEVPTEHTGHDGLIAFEGVGWETDKAAYRLYLDARNATDIYGKKLPDPILPNIGQGVGDYHSMNDWGQDILQVDQSLGIGGIGEVREGKATQIGPGKVIGHVRNLGAVCTEAMVDDLGIDGGAGNLSTHYGICAGSALTMVDAQGDGMAGPVAAGIVHHKDMTVFTSGERSGDWGYIASWGQQSLAGDNLGLVLFFPEDGVATRFNDDGQTLYVTFRHSSDVHYAFAETWVQDASGVRDLDGFKAYIAATLDGLDHPARVVH